jgi:hypothetical protein
MGAVLRILINPRLTDQISFRIKIKFEVHSSVVG